MGAVVENYSLTEKIKLSNRSSYEILYEKIYQLNLHKEKSITLPNVGYDNGANLFPTTDIRGYIIKGKYYSVDELRAIDR